MLNKEQYLRPEIEILKFEAFDIISTSDTGGYNPKEDETPLL